MEGTIEGVVLMGGKSRRMGTNKALLEKDYKQLWENSVVQLKQAGISKVTLSAPEKNSTTWQELRPHLPEDINVIHDKFPDLGPLNGIFSLMMKSSRTWLCFVPVDMPNMNSQTIKNLVDAGLSARCSTFYQSEPLPLFLFNTKYNKQQLYQILTSGRSLAIKHFVDVIQAKPIEKPDIDVWLNLNTPEQWQQFNKSDT